MSNSLTVEPLRAADGWTCEVQVSFPGGQTRHTVTVKPGDLARWGRGEGDAEVAELVRRSFDFLLEREPPTTILRRFELGVIQRYFPDYDEEFGRRWRRSSLTQVEPSRSCLGACRRRRPRM